MQDNINPFSTRFIKPGQIPFQSSDESTALDELVSRLENQNWTGEIVGPHGSGKSTLVESLKGLISQDLHHVTIRTEDDHTSIYRNLLDWLATEKSGSLLIVDGIEQIERHRIEDIISRCQSHQIGLLVTSHESVGLPLLHRCQSGLEPFRAVVRELLQGRTIPITNEEIDYAYNKYSPNLREALFSLYDVYELKRRHRESK